ncbi:MAG: hypothetical protein BWY15_01716 [Firmicutes bacterium ADurb.Bin193]|nr:MAG: hypothetical protein BWY15_01716 [Firmicutes bacterium ADurb.Bin193]
MKSNENEIFEIYKELNIGKSNECIECHKQVCNLSKPVSIWQVGDNYYDSKYKVLFVGKAARGSVGIECNNFLDATEDAYSLYKDRSQWAYWSYTKAIVNELYGLRENDGWEQISFTNMVKCNNSETVDTSTDTLKNNCLHILKAEIKKLAPKNIVFYTHGYDNQIKALFDNIRFSESKSVKIGAKEINIWTFMGLIDGNEIRVIRPGHPERKKKLQFVKYVVDFIKDEV